MIPGILDFGANVIPLSLDDIKKYNIEEVLRSAKNPRFVLSIVTPKENINGILIFSESHLHFKPLNPLLSGDFDHSSPEQDLQKNRVCEFKLSFKDISEEIQLMPIPSMESDGIEEFPVNINFQLHVFKTSWYKYAGGEDKAIIDSYKEKGKPIATVTLRIRDIDMLKGRRTNEQRMEEAMALQEIITSKILRFRPSYQYIDSTLAVFDINFDNIFEEFEELPTSKLTFINERIDHIKRVFGYRAIDKIEDVDNMSLFPLHFVFHDLEEKVDIDSIKRDEGYMSYCLPNMLEEVLQVPQKILSISAAEDIICQMPGYLSTQPMNRYFLLREDGTSFYTLLHKIRSKGPLLFVIIDKKDNVFGGFLGTDFQLNEDFYSNSESFLYKWNTVRAIILTLGPKFF